MSDTTFMRVGRKKIVEFNDKHILIQEPRDQKDADAANRFFKRVGLELEIFAHDQDGVWICDAWGMPYEIYDNLMLDRTTKKNACTSVPDWEWRNG